MNSLHVHAQHVAVDSDVRSAVAVQIANNLSANLNIIEAYNLDDGVAEIGLDGDPTVSRIDRSDYAFHFSRPPVIPAMYRTAGGESIGGERAA